MSDIKIFGSTLDSNTRCKHWNSKLDIIAIKFACWVKLQPPSKTSKLK
ncbi:MAG: hypothetical protein GY830_03770 [Bacteroidetes bacterium]|nr:hypothetical protein [Bacteroidota bacterium]